MIYFVTIFSAIYCSWMLNITTGWVKRLFFALAVLIPAIIWGVRSTDLGIDVNLYAVPIWNISLRISSFSEYQDFYQADSIEFGYLLLNFVLTRIFSDVHVLLFVLASFSCFIILWSLVNSDLKKEAWLGYAFYLFMLLPRTINLVRQGIAMVMLAAAAAALFKRKWKTYFTFVVLGTLFHNSALIALTFPVVYFVFKKKNGSLRQILLTVIVLLVTIFAQSFFSQFLFINDKYEVYLNGYYKPHFTIFSLVNLPFVVVFWLYYKSFRNKFSYSSEEVFFLVTGIILGQLSWIVSVYLARVAQPYNYFILFAPMMLIAWLKKTNRFFWVSIAKSLCIAYACMYFILVFIVNGEGKIFPYQSELLDNFFR